MGKTQGEYTKLIARALRDQLERAGKRYDGIEVYNDHGDALDRQWLCQPTTYMGRRYGADATLSGVDIVVVKNGAVVIAIEVEESSVRPKTVLGDIFGIALAERMHIKRKDYPTKNYPIKNATVIVVVTNEGKGKQPAKYERLERHLARYFQKKPSKAIGKVRILSCSTTELVDRVERLIRLETGKAK